MPAIFQKKGKKGQKKAKCVKILAKMYKIWKCKKNKKGSVGYPTHETARICPGHWRLWYFRHLNAWKYNPFNYFEIKRFFFISSIFFVNFYISEKFSTNCCLTMFDYFVLLALKGLIQNLQGFFISFYWGWLKIDS